jgi:hypothetical protein
MNFLKNIFLVSLTSVFVGSNASATNLVHFIEPKNGAKVTPKFQVKMAVQGMTIGPIGDMAKTKGHHHLIIDGGPIAAGQVVPADATHIHFGKGQTETELELTPGSHKLTLQFANGAHISYGPEMSQSIDVIVVPAEVLKKF